jgi:hypothetical protein
MSFNLKAKGDKETVLATLRSAELDRETRTVLVNAVEGFDDVETEIGLVANGHRHANGALTLTLTTTVTPAEAQESSADDVDGVVP